MGDLFNKPLVRRSAMIAATVMTVVYLTYRGLYTMNFSGPYATFASVVLYGAEAYGGLLMFLFFFQIWDISNPEPAPPLPGRTVDVMIPTYNEDPSLLRGTIAASLRIAYPHRTLVLDDGKWQHCARNLALNMSHARRICTPRPAI
jgi:cellulose synthase/poly-beta-1,6-N-acetylglucosamine synthase-like glycosyltransferase